METNKNNKTIVNLNIFLCIILSLLALIKTGIVYSVMILVICYIMLKTFKKTKLVLFKLFGGIASFTLTMNIVAMTKLKGSIVLIATIIGTILIYQLTINIPRKIRSK